MQRRRVTCVFPTRNRQFPTPTREQPDKGVDEAVVEAIPQVGQARKHPIERLDDVVAARVVLRNHSAGITFPMSGIGKRIKTANRAPRIAK